MWHTKHFVTKLDMDIWLAKFEGSIEWTTIFVENVPYAIEWRRLKLVH